MRRNASPPAELGRLLQRLYAQARRETERRNPPMCECACGEMRLKSIHRIEGTGIVLGIEKYPGCKYCATPFGTVIRLFDAEGVGQWCEGLAFGEPMQADALGGNNGVGYAEGFFSAEDLESAAREDVRLQDLNPADYDSLGDLLAEHGSGLLRAALAIGKRNV